MSGGSYDYAYQKIEELADSIRPSTAIRKAFKTHLRKVAKACHDIEWVDSCDCSPGDENAAIQDVLGEKVSVLALTEILKEAKVVKIELDKSIKRCQEEVKEKK